MHVTLVHNPGAGMGRPSAKVLMAALQDAGYAPVYVSTKEDDLEEALRRATGFVVAAGGDGTVSRVLTLLPERDKPVAILPLGTANNIATFFGIEGTVGEIAASWKNARETKIDVGVAKGPFGERRFIEAVGFGALVDATMRKDRSNAKRTVKVRRGRAWFRKALSKAKPERIESRIDDEEVAGDMLLVEIMNIGLVGPSLRLAPSADPGDGLLDVVLVPAASRKQMIAWLDADDGSEPPVEVRQGRRVVVSINARPLRVGDKFPPATSDAGGVAVEVDAGGATLLLPKKASRKRAAP